MKTIRQFLLLFAATALTTAVNAQQFNGDMNHNDVLDVDDVTMLIGGYLSGEAEVVGPEVNHFHVDNSLVAGTWYRSKTDKLVLNTDGTTNYGNGSYTYRFLPSQGCILFFNASTPVDYIKVIYFGTNSVGRYMTAKLPGKDALAIYYTEPVQPVTSITLSQTTLNLQLDSDPVRLTATVSPSDADNTAVIWSSSDEEVATVSTRGSVEALSEGTAIITCTAADGSGVTATCEVTVGNTAPTPSSNTYTVNGVTFKMVSIAGGTFRMGAQSTSSSSANYDVNANDSEAPVHNVTLSDYSIGETEVTQALWKAVMGSNPSYFIGDKLPVERVSWNDCQTFITKLNQLTGKTFRLPTEAEWEYAARGGTTTSLYNGENIIIAGTNNSPNLDALAWYGGNCGQNYTASAGCDVENGYDISGWSEKQYADSKGGTHPVGLKQPNAYGLYDMLGNVWEWCQDWYGSYDSSAQSNPTGASSGSCRVFRGGSWADTAGSCRVSFRFNYTPTFTNFGLGFRLAQ
ncbi:MAG: SUMF1/EgtB/PvdO family nonheme iron enzyme [Bacteroidaceae bacterium]|nr:SUMF1/EgtB/PvdO family nonheme iron enzyme [Bacteroidaceae bacterium]